mgnify:FL=1
MLFVIDSFEEDAYQKFLILKQELKEFHPKLAEKPYVIALNKADLGNEEALKTFKENGEKPIVTSAITGEGCETLKLALDKLVIPKQKKSSGWASKK